MLLIFLTLATSLHCKWLCRNGRGSLQCCRQLALALEHDKAEDRRLRQEEQYAEQLAAYEKHADSLKEDLMHELENKEGHHNGIANTTKIMTPGWH